MNRDKHRSLIVRAVVGGVVLFTAAAIAQNALDAALDANMMVGGTGYNPHGRASGGGTAGSLRASSFRLDRQSGEIRDSFGGNSAFSRAEYRVGLDGAGTRSAAARAGLTRDQNFPAPAFTNLRQDDVQRRMQGGAFSPNDLRGTTRGGLQSPVYQPFASTSYANPGAVNTYPGMGGGGGGGGGRAGRVSNKVPSGSNSALRAPTYRPHK